MNNTNKSIKQDNAYISVALDHSDLDIKINGKRYNINIALFIAAADGDTETVKLLLANKGIEVNAEDWAGRTPLYYAAANGHTEIVKALMKKGADVNVADRYRCTPLHFAAKFGHTETVKALIEKGADVNLADRYGYTPLTIIENGADVCETIVNHIARLQIASLYVSEKNLHKMQTLGDRSNNQHSQNCREEIKRLEGENRLLYNFLREEDVVNLASIFERNKSVHDIVDSQEVLKEQYSEYAYILINKVDKAKKEIFLYNNKPLIDVLSKNYKKDFQEMSFVGIKNFFMFHKNDDGNLRQETGVTLIVWILKM